MRLKNIQNCWFYPQPQTHKWIPRPFLYIFETRTYISISLRILYILAKFRRADPFFWNNFEKKSIWNTFFSVGYQLLFVQLQLFHTFHFIYIMSFTLLLIGQRGLTWLVERSKWSFTFYLAFWDLILFGTDQMQLLLSIFSKEKFQFHRDVIIMTLSICYNDVIIYDS